MFYAPEEQLLNPIRNVFGLFPEFREFGNFSHEGGIVYWYFRDLSNQVTNTGLTHSGYIPLNDVRTKYMSIVPLEVGSGEVLAGVVTIFYRLVPISRQNAIWAAVKSGWKR